MNFEFATANQIFFGEGAITQVKNLVPGFGTKAFLITGSGSVSLTPLLDVLDDARVSAEIFRVVHEPTITTIRDGLSKAKEAQCDFVIGFGGGSPIDAAKAVAALMTNQGSLLDYLEVIGKGQSITRQPAPMIAIPTSAGTGAEVTRNAVVMSEEDHVKVSMRSPMMIPSVAIVDPELTYGMPPDVTASTGMDALTQVIESFVSKKANPLTDVVAREGILRGARSLFKAFVNGHDTQARADMCLTSLFSGLALANSGLGAVHGFAGPIGGMYAIPHGKVCACLLPAVMKYNVMVINQDDDIDNYRNKYAEIAKIITNEPDADIQDGVIWLADLAKRLEIPGLQALGVPESEFGVIIEKAQASSSMRKNPVKLPDKILWAILAESY